MIFSGIGTTQSMVHPSPVDHLIIHFDPADPTCLIPINASLVNLVNSTPIGQFNSVPPTIVSYFTAWGMNGSNYFTSFGTMDLGSEITIIVWAYPITNTNTTNTLIGMSNLATPNGFETGFNQTYAGNRQMIFFTSNDHQGGGINTPSNIVTYGTWQQLSYCFSKTKNRIETYMNGTSISNDQPASGVWDFNTNNYLLLCGMHSFAHGYNGNLGSIKIYNKELNSGEILSEFNATKGYYGL